MCTTGGLLVVQNIAAVLHHNLGMIAREEIFMKYNIISQMTTKRGDRLGDRDHLAVHDQEDPLLSLVFTPRLFHWLHGYLMSSRLRNGRMHLWHYTTSYRGWITKRRHPQA